MYCYIHSSVDKKLVGKLSYKPNETYFLNYWPDADLCGNPFTDKSTSGMWLELCDGSDNSFPIMWQTKKQTATAQHTCEAETCSAACGLKSEAIPAQMLLSIIFQKPIAIKLQEDNAACIIAMKKGYSPAMRYLRRSQKTSLGLLHDLTEAPRDPTVGDIKVSKADTKIHKGDMFTKALNTNDFNKAIQRIGLT